MSYESATMRAQKVMLEKVCCQSSRTIILNLQKAKLVTYIKHAKCQKPYP